jgi:TolB-like protein/DNA-binding winged helix-turn-helix (wHTH) protein/tetratricopeptide (TPR) repeat protein
MSQPFTPDRVRFGAFEVDLRSGELRKHGIKVKLHDQPFQILTALLEHPGEVVTRDELRTKLWPADTFVDFDVGLNSAIKRLRDALGDSAETPRFVETLPKRGYRFIAAAKVIDPVASVKSLSPEANLEDLRTSILEGHGLALQTEPPKSHLLRSARISAILITMALLLLGALVSREWWERFLTGRNKARIQSLAVLPFENVTGDEAQDYFVDGMTDAITNDLGQVRSLRVISRTTAMRFKGAQKSLREIKDELNVDGIVEGSVARSGSRVRVNIQLIQASPERQVWAQSYEKESTDVLTLQRDVARAIVTEIKAILTPQERALLATSRPIDPEVFADYLWGRFYWNRRTAEDYSKSIEYFKQALEKDPNYAPAYAGLADSYNLLGFSLAEKMAPIEAATKGKEAAKKALQIDDTLAEAHAALGFIMDRYDWDWAGAERELQRAIELNPSYVNAYRWYGFHLRALGRIGEACVEDRHVRELDPLDPNNRPAPDCVRLTGQYEQAIKKYQKDIDLFPNQFNLHFSYAELLADMGRYDDAISEYKIAIDRSGHHPNMVIGLGLGYAAAGKKADAEKILEDMKRAAPKARAESYSFALLCAAIGRENEAIDWLNQSYREHSGGMALLKSSRRLDPLRSNPRFKALLAQVGLPPDSEEGNN